ncbi:cell division protein ZapA [Methyloferula stellata]|uniref:cell division protein ZapA n=1 Tax=Methyloferula stellata TaxID=876270 RepID=UPI000367E73F|nr:cell division protein ZapA [Methyloferula stellata]
MPQVTVTISGHTYRMACAEGEEAHLQGLARSVDEKIEHLKETFGEIGDQRITIMAAITVADELAEAKGKIARLEAEVQNLKANASHVLSNREAWADHIADSLVDAAARIERVAQDLNGGVQD